MKKLSKSLTLIFAVLAFFAILSPKTAVCQYMWTDSVAVSATPIDSAFTIRWQEVTVVFHRDDGLVIVGQPDTTSWASRKMFYIPKNTYCTFKNVRRMKFRSV